MNFAHRTEGVHPSAVREIFKVIGQPGVISFAGGNPDPATFPAADIERLSSQILRKEPALALQYSVTEGYGPLREKLADRLKHQRIGSSSDRVLIVTGGQQGIDLTCRIFCNEGDTVFCEDPSFVGALNAFRLSGVRLRGIPVQQDGMDMDALEQALQQEKRGKLIYTIPTFQNPTGITMSIEKRQKLYDLALQYGVVILEDNPYGDLRFFGEEVPAIKTLDTEGIVIYCSSFSKILSPGIRIGYLCLNEAAAAKIVLAKQAADVHTNIFFQLLVNRYLEECDLDGHISFIRSLYRHKYSILLEELKQNLPAGISFTQPEGGIFVWCTVPGIRDKNLVARLMEQKLAVVPGSAFRTDDNAPCDSIRLNYSMPTEEQLQQGCRILGETIGSLV